MIKIIPPDAWPHLLGDAPQVEQIKVASFGLRGHDLAEFVKRASHPLAAWVKANPPKPGDVYVHTINMGSTEKVGENRNADAYSDAMLRRDHPTFEQAHWFWDHQNTDTTKSGGRVKKAFYSPDIGRVESITALSSTKEAADRNGGVVAERTLKKLASDDQIAVSMSCRVPFDVCTLCGHKAKHRGEYCKGASEGGTCKYAGCRNHLGRVYEDGKVQAVDNPFCSFFDLSDVSRTRGADRTAFVTGKVANPNYVPGGAELAEMLGLVTPDYLLDRNTLGAISALRKLAAVRYPDVAVAPSWDDCVAVRSRLAKASGEVPYPADDYSRQEVVRDLAASGVVLPPARWLSYMTGVPAEKCAAAFAGGLDPVRDLLSRPDCHEMIAESAAVDNRLSAKWAHLAPTAKAHAAETSLGVVAGPPAKTASAPRPLADEAKARYLAYQARAMCAHSNSDSVVHECARHNRAETV